MEYDVLFFGNLSEMEDGGKLHLTEGPNRLSGLEKLLLDKHPGLRDKTYRIAVNQRMADSDCVLKQGDEIALLPPFAGG